MNLKKRLKSSQPLPTATSEESSLLKRLHEAMKYDDAPVLIDSQEQCPCGGTLWNSGDSLKCGHCQKIF